MPEKQVKKVRKPNSWLIHVKAFWKKNPQMKYSDVLKNAKKTYSKKAKE